MGLIPGIGANGFAGASPPAYGKYRVLVSSYKIWVSSDYGTNWTSAVYRSGGFGNEISVNLSDTGQYILICSYYAGVYLSTNYGASFTQIETAGYTWYGAAMSRSGQYMYKTTSTVVYKSSDYGATWTQNYTFTYALTTNSLFCSGDGSVAMAGTASYNFQYYTTNGGTNWYTTTTAYYIQKFALSNTGQYIIGTGGGNSAYIYVSNNSAASWTAITTWTLRGRCAISSTGQYMLACYGGTVYKSSDYGVNWTSTSIAGMSIAGYISADGSIQIIINQAGAIAKSNDFGATWALATEFQDWQVFGATMISA